MKIFETYFRSSVNPGDPVGTLPIFLGGNGAGINNSSMSDGEFGYMFSRGVSSIANGKDPTKPSPHSGYKKKGTGYFLKFDMHKKEQ